MAMMDMCDFSNLPKSTQRAIEVSMAKNAADKAAAKAAANAAAKAAEDENIDTIKQQLMLIENGIKAHKFIDNSTFFSNLKEFRAENAHATMIILACLLRSLKDNSEGSRGGAKPSTEKVLIGNRECVLYKNGNQKLVRVQGKLVPLKDARKMFA